jgi:hypothetical protein
MRIFISWSGDDSKIAAELLHNWLKMVIQEVEPWISQRDIPKGGKWQTSLGNSLSDTSFGILMVTKTNINAPWMLFEAGALSNVPSSSVVPMLCDITKLEIANTPLSQFQAVTVDKKGMLSLIFDINKQSSKRLDDKQLNETFEKWWPDFENEYKCIKFASNRDEAKLKQLPQFEFGNALEDIIQSLRRIEQVVGLPHSYTNTPYANTPLGLTLNSIGGVTSSLGRGPLASSGLTAEQISLVADALKSDNVLKVAALNPNARNVMSALSGGGDPGHKVASKKPDENEVDE